MCLTSLKLRELRESKPCLGIIRCAGGESDQYFVRVKPRVFAL